MTIRKIYLHNLRNDAHFQFHTEFRDLVMKHTPSALKIAPLWGVYMSHYNREDDALKKIVKSALTRQIQEADAARDEAFSALAETQSAAVKHFSAARREAARRLQVVFDTYGNVAKKRLNEETSAISNFVNDIKGAKYAEDARDAGIYDWVEELERRNEAFEALMKRRFEETGDKCDIVLKSERAELDEAYKKIAVRINALAEVEGFGAYEAFMHTLNAVIAKYAVKAHRHHHEKAPDDGGSAAA